jgi:hypothetical protein
LPDMAIAVNTAAFREEVMLSIAKIRSVPKLHLLLTVRSVTGEFASARLAVYQLGKNLRSMTNRDQGAIKCTTACTPGDPLIHWELIVPASQAARS